MRLGWWAAGGGGRREPPGPERRKVHCLPHAAALCPLSLQSAAIKAAAAASTDAFFERDDTPPDGKDGDRIKAGQGQEVSRR